MDRDYLIDLFSEFGAIALRRMFSGYGISADGVNFAMALGAGIIFRVDEFTVARYDAEGAKPFQYETRTKTVVVNSYRHLPERLYDDPEELAVWAREALEAARRAAVKKPKRKAGKRIAATKAAAAKGRGSSGIVAPKSRAVKTPSIKRKHPASKAGGKKTALRKAGKAKRQAT